MAYVKWIILIIVLLFFTTFGVKNSQSVYLNYYFGIEYLEIPLYGLVFIAVLIGIVVGMLVGIFNRLHLRQTVKRLEKEKSELGKELAAGEQKESAKAIGLGEQKEREEKEEESMEGGESPQSS